MDLNKKNIENIFQEVMLPSSDVSFFDSESLLNIQIFADEVLLDIEIANPTLQYKKKNRVIMCVGYKVKF